jgi:hypothetical protein
MSDDGGKNRQAKDRRTTRRPVEVSVDAAQLPQEVALSAPDVVETPAQELPVAEAVAEVATSDVTEPPSPLTPPFPAPPTKPSLVLPAALALLIGGGAGFAGGLYGPGLLGRTSAPDTSALQRLQGEVAALTNRPAPAIPETFNQRITQSEADLKAELQALSATVSELRARPAAAAPDMAPLTSRLGALEQSTANRAAANLGAPIYVVTMGLAQAAEQGRGFAGELAALEQLGVAPARLAALKPFATTGLPSAQRLAQNFAPVAKQISEASALKTGGALSWAQSLVKVRAPGGDILTTIDAALRNGDLPAATSLLDNLPEAHKALAAPFAASLRARSAAGEAISALQQAATAGLQSSATGKPAP